MRTACLAGDLELLRATAEQTTNASNSNKKNNHLYIYTGLCGPLRRAFRSRIRSLRRDLRGCRFPRGLEAVGGSGWRAGGFPRAGCTRSHRLSGGGGGAGSSSPGRATKTGAVLPSSAAGPDCKSPSPVPVRTSSGRNPVLWYSWNYRNFRAFIYLFIYLTLICINILCAVMAG